MPKTNNKTISKEQITPFCQAVYRAASLVPAGRVTSYGAIARFLGKPGSARAVGNALHINPFAPKVPCHRVVKSDGSIGGFADGAKKKIAILRREGVICLNGHVQDWSKKYYSF